MSLGNNMGRCHRRVGIDMIIGVIRNVRGRGHRQGRGDRGECDGEGIFGMGMGMRWHLVYITVNAERVVGTVFMHVGRV
jgi:hypothetical protein